MSATLKFTDYLNNKKKLNVPTTLPIGNEPVMSTGEIGNVTMPKYTDALNGSSFGNTKQQLPAGIQAVQLTEATPNYSDAVKPGMLTPGSEQVGYIVPKPTPDVTVTEPLSFEEYILSQKSKADDQYKRDILNAQNTYDQSKSAYGTKAASLSNMGLTGSGYSDYLDSRAYGQMQADKNAARDTRQNAYNQLDAKYMDYLNQKETASKNAYISMLGTITADTPLSEIENFANAYGLSPEQIETLKTAREDRIKTYLDTNDYTVDTLKRLLGEDHASYSDYLTKLQGTVGSIDSSWFSDEETGELVSKQKAQEVLNGLKDYGLTEEQMQKAQEVLDATYAISSGGSVTFNRDGGADRPGTDGNNISVKDGDGKKYRVQYSGENDESGAVKKAAEARGLKEGDVFMYKDKVYVIQDGKCYGIEKRDNAYAGHWSALLDKLKGNEYTTEE